MQITDKAKDEWRLRRRNVKLYGDKLARVYEQLASDASHADECCKYDKMNAT